MKRFLNAQANRVLGQLDYSDHRIQDAKREAWWWLQARWQMLSSHKRLLAGSAVVWTGPSRAQLVRIEVPLAGPGEVTIQVDKSVVSPGTERAQYLRLPNTSVSYPHLPGYSAAGVVLAVGSGVTHVKPGDLVAARGVAHVSVATIAGAQASLVPRGVTAEAAATLQLGTISAQGVRRAAIEPGERVCVIGAGLIGLLAQRLACAAGAGSTIVVAASRGKESIALSGGASRFLVPVEDRGEIEAVSAPVVIEATGDPDALEVAVAAAGPNGRVVLLGSPRGMTKEVPVGQIRAKRLHLIGAHVETLAAESRIAGTDLYGQVAEGYLRALAEDWVTVDDLLGLVVDPREVEAFYRDLVQRRDIVGAAFDWKRLPDWARARPAQVSRLPDMMARGIEFDRKSIVTGARRRRWQIQKPEDHFEGASGRLRVGLLGCGEIGLTNAAAIAAAPNAHLVACFDPDTVLAEELGAAHGATVCATADGLLETRDVDAVLVAVPHHLHAQLAVKAAEAGKHVVVEKPLANNLAAAVDISVAAERSGVVLSICFPQRYLPHVVHAKRLIDAGILGEFSGMLIKVLSKKPEAYWYGGYSGRSASDWRTSRQKAGGGFLIMNLCHYIDIVRHLTGHEAERVTAYLEEPVSGRDVENAVSVAIRYDNSGMGTIVGSAGLVGFETAKNEIHIWGNDGHLTLEPNLTAHTLRVVEGLTPGRWHTYNRLATRSEIDIRAIYFSRLATAIASGMPPDVTAEDGLAIQAFLEAAYRSGEVGQGVRPADLLTKLTKGILA